MSRDKWIWMPHAGHFICGSRCQFKLNTYVNGYIVSTVGEMPNSLRDDSKFENIGYARLYETMVFPAKKSENKCCPFVMVSGENIDFEGYQEADKAYEGHLRMCLKYDKEQSK